MLKLTENEKRLVAKGDARKLKDAVTKSLETLVLPRILKGNVLEDIKYYQGVYYILKEIEEILETS